MIHPLFEVKANDFSDDHVHIVIHDYDYAFLGHIIAKSIEFNCCHTNICFFIFYAICMVIFFVLLNNKFPIKTKSFLIIALEKDSVSILFLSSFLHTCYRHLMRKQKHSPYLILVSLQIRYGTCYCWKRNH